jgi:hypothetical protein
MRNIFRSKAKKKFALLPPIIYSTPGSRWVDPALGFDFKQAGLPHYYEVTWDIGSQDIACADNASKCGAGAPLLVALLRMLALYIASLHAAETGIVRFHYYRKREEPGYLKIDANGEFIAVAYDLGVVDSRQVLNDLARMRTIQRHVGSIESASLGFVPIVLFGADQQRVYYLESMYGVPEPNAFFNSRSIEFLAHMAPLLLQRPLSTLTHTPRDLRLADDQALMEFLAFEPLMAKQLQDCPPELIEQFVRQVVSAAADHESRTTRP